MRTMQEQPRRMPLSTIMLTAALFAVATVALLQAFASIDLLRRDLDNGQALVTALISLAVAMVALYINDWRLGREMSRARQEREQARRVQRGQ